MASKTNTTTEAEDFDEFEDVVDDGEDVPDNVIALREGADTAGAELATEPQRPPLTTPQKVGVGVGVATGAGLVGWGLYRLGKRFGWWGVSPLIIDDDEPSEKGSGGGSTPSKSDSKPSGPGRWNIRATGKPPNVSGNSEGYNTQIFTHPGAVRLAMNTIGYKVEYSNATLVPNNQPHPKVVEFQRDWNKVIRGLDSGRVKFPSPVDDPSKLQAFRGLLDDDGIPGKNTLNAMEIALANMLKNKMPWRNLVVQA